MSIERLNTRNPADVNAVADLHVTHLGDSPIVGLGPAFLRRFFYVKLVEDGLVGVTVCRKDGSIVGFISYTPDPNGFMMRGVRRHFFFLCWLMSTSLLLRPSMIRGILLALRFMRERGGEAGKEPAPGLGEVISLVALPDCQNYVPPGGKSRLTVRLFESMVEYFREKDYDRVHLLVQPSNRASNIFCSVMGCKFEKITTAGMVTHRYTYFLKPQPAAAVSG